MKLDLSADDLLTTTRSVRRRLEWQRPVEREIVEECLDIALQAPSGGNAQGWHWVLVDDAPTKQALAAVYIANFEQYLTAASAKSPTAGTGAERAARMSESAVALSDNLHRMPFILVPCIEGRAEQRSGSTAGFWGSILPAVWSFMLALRERGLGSAWTTLHLLNDGERQAAEILGIPYDTVSQAGMFPIAYTRGTDFRRAPRQPLESVLHRNHW